MSAYTAASAATTPAPGLTNGPNPIVSDRRFVELVQKRNALGWTLSAVMMVIYLVFILLVAYDKPLLATKVAGTTSLGIVLGLVVIAAAIILTALYVARANGRFDDLTAELEREYGR